MSERNKKMSEDKRIKHTKQRIAEAMIDCLQKISLDSVTVKKLCEVADINRSTFYAYYADPFELYEVLEKGALEGLDVYFSKLKANDLSYRDFLKHMISYIETHEKVFLALIKTNSSSLKAASIAQIEKLGMFDFPQLKDYKDYAMEYFISGALSTITKWLSDGKKQPAEKLAELLYGLTVGKK
ncbi:MAG: TetR family transcriptional regulator C-terminal domain-containing protein [Lachnospiraceae bacterium]|nr:TetR family transcriptional regulator C-terminal domain-containing protein [Lachnospiraceae bacterium]